MYPRVPSPSDPGRGCVPFVVPAPLKTVRRAKPRRPFVAAAAMMEEEGGRGGNSQKSRNKWKEERKKRKPLKEKFLLVLWFLACS